MAEEQWASSMTINGKKFQRPSPYDPNSASIPIVAPTLGPGLGLVLPEKLIPGTRNVIMAANIIGFAIESVNQFAKGSKNSQHAN
ncbi:hypothetical protein [Pedobacter terrae]|uniref:hypothetical protein n=1 Tax=Pedobacter terrae TaxID=405671 RepID=UPI002FF5E272